MSSRSSAEQALREADRRKDEFLAILAHELRNPLAPIRNATKLAKSPNATAAHATWSLDVIDRQVEHMARLLDDLLEVSRISRGSLELRKHHVEFASTLSAAVETARPLIEAKRHTLSLDLPDEPIILYADDVRVAQILSNLLTNAAKYTDADGHITVRARCENGRLIISARDDGMGISAEMLPKVFEMFSQARSAITRAEGGLGIGCRSFAVSSSFMRAQSKRRASHALVKSVP